jgi:aryl-alcohol dehydrogenase-like predicted oxidoreductase
MQYRKLGRTNYEVSAMGYGAWGIGGKQWLGGSDHESLAALRRAIELGLNFIDTALAYGDGHSEQLVGQVVRDAGRRIYVATKVPPMNMLWPSRPGIGIEQVFPYDYILRSAGQSLRNLHVETIDLLQLHAWSPEWIAREEWRRAFEELKRAGKVRSAGISINSHDPDSALEIIETGLIDTVQVIYNIFDQSPARKLFALALARNVGVIARVPLDEGGLSGAITERSTFEPEDFRSHYFRGERKKQVREHVESLQRDLGPGAGPLADVALRFCLSHPAVSTVIPGMRSVRHAEANCALPDRGPLPPATLDILRRHAWERNFYD